MRSVLLVLLTVTACVREVPAKAPVPPAVASHHIAEGVLLAGVPGAKCDPVIETAAFDSATCLMPAGDLVYCWHAVPGGMNCFTIPAPQKQAPKSTPVEPPKTEVPPAPAIAPPAKAEAPKKK